LQSSKVKFYLKQLKRGSAVTKFIKDAETVPCKSIYI